MKFKTFRYTLIITLTAFIMTGFAWADDKVIRGKFDGKFAAGNPTALFDGVLKIDGERLRFDGETYSDFFPDGTICQSDFNACSVWITDEGELYNQTDDFKPASDGTYTQLISFVGGTGEFEGASGMAWIQGTIDFVNGVFDGKLIGVILEGDDYDDGEDDDND